MKTRREKALGEVSEGEFSLEQLGRRLREVRGKLSQREFSQKIGIHQNSLSQYETGLREPGASVISKVCRLFAVHPTWLLTGRGEIALGMPWNGMVEIPIFDGTGGVTPGKSPSNWRKTGGCVFPETYVRDVLRAESGELFFLTVLDETMTPTLRPGELVLIDKRQRKVEHGGVFLVRLDHEWLVKRIQPLPGQIWEVTADNPVYTSFRVEAGKVAASSAFELLGRVILVFRQS